MGLFPGGTPETYDLLAASGTTYTLPAARSVRFTLTANSTMVIPAGTSGAQLYVLVTQDGTGARTLTLSGVTIAWVSGAPTFTIAANRSTWVHLTWTGTAWSGVHISDIPPYFTQAPTTYGGQTVHYPFLVMRGASTQSMNYHLDALVTYTSAAWRQRLAGKGVSIQLGYYPTDTPAGNYVRGTLFGTVVDVSYGGFYGAGNTLNLRDWAYLGSGEANQSRDVILHELSHAEDADYYTDAEISYNGQAWDQISNMTPLVNTWNAIVATGTPPAPNRFEWYAQMRRSQRIGTDNARMLTECRGSQTRVDEFTTFINSLGLL